jgi:3-oxoacyl-[acyl-carrier-protein] synthase III
MGVTFIGCGAAAPTAVVSNDALSQFVDTSDEWIASRTGIRQRHLASAEESIGSLGATAAQQALEMAGLAAADIDMIILATSTPDDLYGSACLIQAKIGATRAVAFDLSAACSGFVFALVTASQFIQTGSYQNILVIGADIHSRWVDWQDRNTCVLFGDGAGAVVLQTSDREDLLGFELRSDGTQNESLHLRYHGTTQNLSPEVTVEQGGFGRLMMNGKEVYRFAVNSVPDVIDKALFKAGLQVLDIDWLILHQANQRIMDAVADRIGLPPERIVSNVAEYGNTSAASIPIALNAAVRSGQIKAGDTIATSGFGAGLSWGAAILRWGSRSASK